MKPTTSEWFNAAEDDLLSAKKLSEETRLTNIVAFHCQICLEKSIKGFIEQRELPSIKSHDLIRLSELAELILSEDEQMKIAIINEVYIDSRYPGELGLMPNGKPSPDEIKQFISFTETLFNRLKSLSD